MSWNESKLKELGETLTGSTPKTVDRENLGDYIPFIKPGDFESKGSLNYKNFGLSKIGSEKSRIIKKGSVLMVCIGATIGKVGFSDRDICTNQQINSINPNSGIDTKFLYYYMSTEDFKKRVITSSGQATMPIINKTKWSNLEVTYPPLPVQKKIVEKLDAAFADIDKAISVTEKNIENDESLYQSILIETFESLNKPSIKYLGELCEVIAGQSPNGKFYNEKQEGFPFYQGKKLFGKKFLREPNVWTSKVSKIAKKNDLLISVRAPVGEINFTKEEICIGRGLAAIRVNSIINRDYLYFYLKRIKNEITGTKGAVFNSINKSQIQSLDIPLVELNEQLNIVLKLNNIHDQIDKIRNIYSRKLNEYNSLKSSILIQAFSGELTKDAA